MVQTIVHLFFHITCSFISLKNGVQECPISSAISVLHCCFCISENFAFLLSLRSNYVHRVPILIDIDTMCTNNKKNEDKNHVFPENRPTAKFCENIIVFKIVNNIFHFLENPLLRQTLMNKVWCQLWSENLMVWPFNQNIQWSLPAVFDPSV